MLRRTNLLSLNNLRMSPTPSSVTSTIAGVWVVAGPALYSADFGMVVLKFTYRTLLCLTELRQWTYCDPPCGSHIIQMYSSFRRSKQMMHVVLFNQEILPSPFVDFIAEA